ncbi:MAG: ABC transporter permease [Gammaproteobacteria bacterium]|nr:ABC transporter permease [Gammaproteobacteria bacterium]
MLVNRWYPIWVVAQKELLVHLQSAAFWFIWGSISALLALLVLLFGLMAIFSSNTTLIPNVDDLQLAVSKNVGEQEDMLLHMQGESMLVYGVIDNTDGFSDRIRFAIRRHAERWNVDADTSDYIRLFINDGNDAELIWFTSSPILEFRELQDPFDSIATADSWLESGKIDGYFVLPEDFVESPNDARFVTRMTGIIIRDSNLTRLKSWYENMATIALRYTRLEDLDVDEVGRIQFVNNVDMTIEKIQSSPNLVRTNNPIPSGVADNALSNLHGVVSVSYTGLFLVLLLFGSTVLITNTVEEKSTRVNEILCSTIQPQQLFDGKILGNVMLVGVALSFVGVLVFAAVMLLSIKDSFSRADLLMTFIPPMKLTHWLIFLLGALLLYGPMLTALGSLCDDIKEVGSTLFPVSYLVSFGALPALFYAFFSPHSVLTQVLTLIPPLTPYVMIARSSDLPSWPIYVAALGVLSMSIVLVRFMCLRIFNNGLLAERTAMGFRTFFRLATRPVN